ncbi:MAG TPA: energy-coupling factor ABC transporter permease [Actinomycetota bacterium]
MHIPDGFIGAGVSLGAGVVSAGGVGVALKRSADTLEERQAPLAGLVAAFVFAMQMLNFPVAAGTSGHLLGAVLAGVLVGPWAGAVCISLVLLVQALFFADGGLSALGLNVLNMAILGGLGGYAIFAVIRGVLPRTRPMIVAASAVAAGMSVVLASIGFFVEYALGGVGDVSLRAVFTAMVGVHALIGIGEAVLTGLTVSAVLAVRPDLVYGARGLMPALETRASQPAVER